MFKTLLKFLILISINFSFKGHKIVANSGDGQWIAGTFQTSGSYIFFLTRSLQPSEACMQDRHINTKIHTQNKDESLLVILNVPKKKTLCLRHSY